MRRGKRMLEKLEADIREHIERETQDNIDRGMPREEARCAAMRKFGNLMRVKEETRAVWRVSTHTTCCNSESVSLSRQRL